MGDLTHCPACKSVSEEGAGSLQLISEYPLKILNNLEDNQLLLSCIICGRYSMSLQFYNNSFCPKLEKMNNVQRAAFSHFIATSNLNDKFPNIYEENFESIISRTGLPSPSTQVTNFIRFIGEKQSKIGHSIVDLPKNFFSIIGAPNIEIALELISQMADRGLVQYRRRYEIGDEFVENINIGLTLKGWELFESEKRGDIASKYGFVAYQFDNKEFPKLLDYVRPKIYSSIGYRLNDMGIEKSVGTIDNIMRMRIREAAFVIADLTDDNHGAYWEAGFADGLNKPVIYVCEETKFNEFGTHFDTNHQLTLKWNLGNLQNFYEELIGTIKEALKI